MKGYVYILINDAMPGLVKIGRTSRDVDLRASELWQTGVPEKFQVFWSFKTPDCVQLEAYVHGDLREYRVSKSREFFKIDEFEAKDRIRLWAEIQAWEWADEVFSEFTTVHISKACAVNGIADLAEKTGHPPGIISRALSMVTPGEIAPAIVRAKEEIRKEQIETFRSIGIPESEWGDLIRE